MEEGRGLCRGLVGKPEGKSPLGRPRRRWEDNVKLDLKEVRCEGMDLIDLAQDRFRWRAFVNCGNESSGPKSGGNFLTS